MSKRILILGAGKEQVPAIEAAARKGIRTLVLDMNAEAEGAALADEFRPVSTRDIGAILGFLGEYKAKIDGVMTIASDIPHCVSAVAEVLGVPHIALEVARRCIDKFAMKQALLAGGVNIPEFAAIASVDDLKAFITRFGHPAVIKPVDNSGARGVLRLTRAIDLDWAFAYAKQFSYSGRVEVERFIPGLQISTEGLVLDGRLHTTGFADRNYARLDDTAPYMVEDGGDIPTILGARDRQSVIAEFDKAVSALGIDWGPAKGDMVFGEDGKAYVIEIAARLSGGNFCYDKVPWSTGVDIVDILVDMAVGNPVDPQRFEPDRNLATVQRYFFPPPGRIEAIRGLERAKAIPEIRKLDLWVKPGATVAAAENHPSRVGYVIACAPTRATATAAAEKAVRAVDFVMALEANPETEITFSAAKRGRGRDPSRQRREGEVVPATDPHLTRSPRTSIRGSHPLPPQSGRRG
ncbi:MAG TPA: ATP-grasp domain-containing protein [Stellaceae bacterium]|nr:ATP-grasp domain-containing protein [Stellaceae bacterium]